MNELQHYDEDVLIDYLVSPDSVEGGNDITEHLGVCSSCSSMLDGYRSFSQSLCDPEVWEREEFSQVLAGPDENRVSEFLAYVERARKEREDAVKGADQLLSIPPVDRNEFIELSPDLWTVGMAQELCDRAFDNVDRVPGYSLELTRSALAISKRVSPASYPPNIVQKVRGRAWKEFAQALRYAGRYLEALDALDQAEHSYLHATVSDFDLAIVAYVRAYVLGDLDRLNEAMSLIRYSACVFAQFGHQRRYVHARLTEGIILYNSGDIRAARGIWLDLLQPVRGNDDLQALGSLLHNIANCCAELQDLGGASEYLIQAISIFEDLGIEGEALRSRWLLARMLLDAGKPHDAISRLRGIQERFESLQMFGEAALVALDMVEVMLTIREFNEAAVICRYLVEQFTRVGRDSKAITAVSYLREAISAGKASAKLAKHVRTYVAELPKRQELLFLPPPL